MSTEQTKNNSSIGLIRLFLSLRFFVRVLKYLAVVVVFVFPVLFLFNGLASEFIKALEEIPVSSDSFGRENYQMGEHLGEFDSTSYRQAVDNFKQAVWQEKYLVFWNDNKNLPVYYENLGKAYMNVNKQKESAEAFDESVRYYIKYHGKGTSSYAFAGYEAAIMYSKLNEPDKEMDRIKTACEFYERLPAERQNKDCARVYIWLAHCYHEAKLYEDAAEYFDKGIRLLYDNIDWGIDDLSDVYLLALSYKSAMFVNEHLAQTEKYEEYKKLYDNITYLRDLSDKKLEEFTSHFGWEIA